MFTFFNINQVFEYYNYIANKVGQIDFFCTFFIHTKTAALQLRAQCLGSSNFSPRLMCPLVSLLVGTLAIPLMAKT